MFVSEDDSRLALSLLQQLVLTQERISIASEISKFAPFVRLPNALLTSRSSGSVSQ
jgi:hypothetical protein